MEISEDLPTKECTSCHEVKSIGEFYKRANVKYGVDSWCKKCKVADSTAYYTAHKEKKVAYHAKLHDQYKLKNKDRNPYDGTDKKCPMCKETLPQTEQYWRIHQSTLGGLCSYCRDCQIIKGLKTKARVRHELLDFPTNFTGKQARELKARQNNCCYVCGHKENGKKLHLDHNHRTGRIRGFACGDCNSKGILPWLDRMVRDYPEKLSDLCKSDLIRRILYDPPAKYLYE